MILLPDPLYNPNYIDVDNLTPSTKLAPNVPLAKFLGSYGDKMALRRIQDPIVRSQLVRNLYPHAELLRSISLGKDLFPTVNVIVSEGVYRHQSIRGIAGENIKKSDGRLVVYQVVDTNGRVDNDKTFEIAEYWKDYFHFGKITLEYDTYSPDGKLNSQIAVEMPVIPSTFNVTFKYEVETKYNHTVLARDELLEIMPSKEECIKTWEKEDKYLSSNSKLYDWVPPEEYTGRNGNLEANELTSIGSGFMMSDYAANQYLKMVKAAKKDGIVWGVTEAYRDYKEQVRLAIKYGLYSEGGKAAMPGTSLHGLGSAVDLNTNASGRWAPGSGLKTSDAAYIWLKKNGSKFGFKTIPREPWHWEFYWKSV